MDINVSAGPGIAEITVKVCMLCKKKETFSDQLI